MTTKLRFLVMNEDEDGYAKAASLHSTLQGAFDRLADIGAEHGVELAEDEDLIAIPTGEYGGYSEYYIVEMVEED